MKGKVFLSFLKTIQIKAPLMNFNFCEYEKTERNFHQKLLSKLNKK